ncbi:NADP-dependent oxidoreductase domain-containing protein [Ganoderma leucocontextum]|nr:NADP-dependent oxidoreductase domain-containing protein [Ganoderma leucocontextum]
MSTTGALTINFAPYLCANSRSPRSSVDMWNLHGPERETPYEDTLRPVLHKDKLKRFGISNYMAWEVAEIVGFCRANGWVQPSAYQGLYNVVHRKVEPKLFPCLRKFGIAFYEYNPRASFPSTPFPDASEPGTCFDPDTNQGKAYRVRYWNEPYFRALAKIEVVARKHGLTLAEKALR